MSDQVAQRRRIPGTRQLTPLLVPSYSSRGFMPLKSLHGALKSATIRTSLVSAYDIHHDALPIEAAYESDLTFLDSGGYEGYASSELSTPRPWGLQQYRDVLDRLQDRSTIVAVSFDYQRGLSVAEQIRRADELRASYPAFGWDLLIKPENPADPYLEVGELAAMAGDMEGFALLGVTEDELGASLMSRTENVRRVRRSLSEAGLNLPIHIFGCLDPVAIPHYVRAGADVFDGLQWLRSDFRPDGLLRLSSAIALNGHGDANEDEVRMVYRRENVQKMRRLELALAKQLPSPNDSSQADVGTRLTDSSPLGPLEGRD